VPQGVRHRVYEPEHIDVDPMRTSAANFGLVFICAERMQAPIRASLRAFSGMVAKIDGSVPREPAIVQP
jgi:hypothetical protein